MMWFQSKWPNDLLHNNGIVFFFIKCYAMSGQSNFETDFNIPGSACFGEYWFLILFLTILKS